MKKTLDRKKLRWTQIGYVAKNWGEWDIDNMSFSKTIKDAKKWKGQWTNFVWKGDPAKRKAIAGTEYQSAMAGNVGLAVEAICKADRWTICRVNIPADQDEAQRQMIPQKGVKHSVRCAPLPTVLVESSIRWRILKWLSRKAPTVLQ